MNIAFTGSRGITELNQDMKDALDKIGPGDCIIHGGARGADTLVEDYALARGISVKQIRPVNPAIKAHYLYRNIEILCQSDQVLVFWDGASRGTRFVHDYAKSRGYFVEVVYG